MIKFIIGVIVGLYISEFYDYTFTNLVDYISNLLNSHKSN